MSPDLLSCSDPELRRETSGSISAAHTSPSEFTGHQHGQSSYADWFALHHCGLEIFPFLNLTCCRPFVTTLSADSPRRAGLMTYPSSAEQKGGIISRLILPSGKEGSNSDESQQRPSYLSLKNLIPKWSAMADPSGCCYPEDPLCWLGWAQ